MKKYPKVPRHDLDFVPEELFVADDLYLLEKMDGMNLRFTLYEEEFKDEYSEQVRETEPSNGDLVFGSKTVVRGSASDDLQDFDPELRPAVRRLRDIPKKQIESFQEDHGPLTFYMEYMVPHTLDYGYENSPPPKLVGFDIYSSREDHRSGDDYASNPYKEKFVGFLELEDSREMFQKIGIQLAPMVATPESIGQEFDPSNFEVPISEHAEVKAEGVVIRSDSMQVRSKYVRESFREMHKSAMGGHANKSEEPHEWLVDALVSPQRIRKVVRKMVISMGYSFSEDDDFIDTVAQTTLVDAWTEEFSEIQEIDSYITPSKIHEPARNRVENVIERMKMTSARTDQNPAEVWSSMDDTTDTSVATKPSVIERGRSKEKDISMECVKSNIEPEDILIDEIVGRDTISGIIDQKDSVDGSDLRPIVDQIEDRFWTSETSDMVLWRLSVSFNPTEVRQKIIERVKTKIEEESGVDLDKGGSSWDPSAEEADFEGLGDMFK